MAETLWIGRDSWTETLELAECFTPYETGGMLLGYQASNGEAVVTAIIGPGPKATHRRHRFIPDHAYQQSVLEAHFHDSDGRETYLGDWHTHPMGRCALSAIDKRTLSRIAKTPSSDTKHPVMLVLAGDRWNWRVCGARWRSQVRCVFYTRYFIDALSVRIFG